MENLETFLKNEEKEYKQRVTEKSKTGLEMEYHSFKIAIKENVQWIEDAYEDYALCLIMHKDIKKDTLECRIKRNKLYIIHWQNMIEIIVEELLKRS